MAVHRTFLLVFIFVGIAQQSAFGEDFDIFPKLLEPSPDFLNALPFGMYKIFAEEKLDSYTIRIGPKGELTHSMIHDPELPVLLQFVVDQKFRWLGHPPLPVDPWGNIQRVKHGSLARAKPLWVAGEMIIYQGRIIWMTGFSGTYRPPLDYLYRMKEELIRLKVAGAQSLIITDDCLEFKVSFLREKSRNLEDKKISFFRLIDLQVGRSCRSQVLDIRPTK